MEYPPCRDRSNEIIIKGDGFLKTIFQEDGSILVQTKWISVEQIFPTCKKVLAIYASKPNSMYNMRHDGWFRDTIYACRIHEDKFIIESHGPYLPATHWMPLPSPPKE